MGDLENKLRVIWKAYLMFLDILEEIRLETIYGGSCFFFADKRFSINLL